MADTIRPTDIDYLVPEYWTSKLQYLTREALVMGLLASDDSALMPSGGDTINYPSLAAMSANAKVAGSEVTLQQPADGTKQLTTNLHYESTAVIEQAASSVSAVNLMQAFTQRASQAVAKQIDDDLIGLYSGCTETVAATSDTGDNLYAHIVEAITELNTNNCPSNKNYRFVHDADTLSRLLQVGKFIDNDYGTGGPVSTGDMNKRLGMSMYLSNNVPNATVSSTTTHHNPIFYSDGKNGMESLTAPRIAFKIAPKIEINYRPELLGYQITAHAKYGVLLLYPDWWVDFTITS